LIVFAFTSRFNQEEKEDAPPPLDEGDIALLKSYGLGPYSVSIKTLEEEIKKHQQTVKDLIGIKESDTGLSPPSMWDLVGDKQMMSEEAPLQVARCTKIISGEGDSENGGGGGGGGGPPNAMNSSNAAGNKYVINVKQIAKFVVGLGEKVAPTDIEEGMRVGVDRSKYSIQIPLPPKIDPTVSLMTVEDKPDVTYDDVGGAKDAMEKLREVLETPLLHPERFVTLGIEPPKGVLLYGPPGTGKTLTARAVANRTDACFIRVIGSELVQKYVGEGARMVRELFTMARSKRGKTETYSSKKTMERKGLEKSEIYFLVCANDRSLTISFLGYYQHALFSLMKLMRLEGPVQEETRMEVTMRYNVRCFKS
jgi:26S proteasome regulatory subunit T1